jgi:hypothetical protein
MWILTAVEVIGGTAGMALICHRIEQAMLAAKGYDTRDFFRPLQGPTARPPASPVSIPPLWSEEDARQAAISYQSNPLAFWLDPNLWGDNPDWRDHLLPAEPLVGSVMRMRAHIDKRKEAETLPCGCPIDTPIGGGRQPYLGWPFSVCYRCMAEWEPPSNDSTGRRLGQGEKVNFANFKHGVCPAEDCRSPCKLETRYHTPFYHCTSPICDKSNQGWSTNGAQWVRSKRNGWRPKRSAAEITRRNKLLAKRNGEDYENDMPPPPRSY